MDELHVNCTAKLLNEEEKREKDKGEDKEAVERAAWVQAPELPLYS